MEAAPLWVSLPVGAALRVLLWWSNAAQFEFRPLLVAERFDPTLLAVTFGLHALAS